MTVEKACVCIILFSATHEFIPSASTVLLYWGKIYAMSHGRMNTYRTDLNPADYTYKDDA